jgi:hypothetical protein
MSSPWSVRTSWYCGIILSLFSILSAADQTVRLHRLSSHRDGLHNIRELLSKTNGERRHSTKTGRLAPSLLQICTWQMPVMFLTSATVCMIVGMFLHVWSATTHLNYPSLWDDNTKVFTLFRLASMLRSNNRTIGWGGLQHGGCGGHRHLLHWSNLAFLTPSSLATEFMGARRNRPT